MAEFSDSDGAIELDLFGEPVRPPRGPGRPAFVPTAENRAFVSMMFVCGHKPIDVARTIGLKKTAFYEHFREEIAERGIAALKYRGRQLLRLHRQAEAGNVAAEKALAGMIQAEQMKTASDAFPGKDTPKRKGLKETRRDAAWSAGKGDEGWEGLLHGTGDAPLAH